MAEEIGVKLRLDANDGKKSMKEFNELVEEAKGDLIEMSRQFGATSKEAANAAQRVAELEGSMRDATELANAFNPENKFRALGSVVSTTIGGFTALQGVMGLLGAESEETQAAILKVQSALAISQGFSQLQEGVKTFQNLGAVIKSTTVFQQANAVATNLAAGAMRLFGVQTTTTSTAFTVLKGAIAATGIGLLVVAISSAISAISSFTSETDEATDSQEDFARAIENVNNQLSSSEALLTRYQRLEVARAKQAGKTPKEIFEIEQKYRNLNLENALKASEKLAFIDEVEAGKARKRALELNNDIQVAQIEFEIAEKERKKAAAEKETREIAEARKKAEEQARRDLEAENRQFAARPNLPTTINLKDLPKSPEQLQLEAEVKARNEARLAEELQQKISAETDAKYTQQKVANSETRKATDQAEFENRMRLMSASSQLASSISQLVGEQTVAGKALAIAQATIDTYAGAVAILRNTARTPAGGIPGFAVVQMIATIAAGLTTVKKIASVQVPGRGAGGAGAGAATSAPLQATLPQATLTRLDSDSLNAVGSATSRAFVLEADVSNNQERIRRLNRAARI